MAFDLKSTQWKFPLDEAKKKQSLAVIQIEAARKHIRHYPSFAEHVWNQLRFQSFRHWFLQGSILLAAMLLALCLRKKNVGNLEMLAACSVFFVFAGNICLSHVARLFSWHMAELEQTLYLNLKQMICIKMLEAGIFDLIILALFLGITGPGITIGIGTTLIYMLVPFLWSDVLYLYMLVSFHNISSGFRSLGLGILCGILALFPVLWESTYEEEYLIIWQILAVGGLILLAAEISIILKKAESSDHICLN